MAVAAVLLTACGGASKPAANGHLRVVASFYPLAEVARRVGGGRVEVADLTPVGVEPHDFELTTDDVDAIEDAGVVLYVGSGFQPAIAKAVTHRKDGGVDVGRAVRTGDDPHFWLDPTRMIKAVEQVARVFEDADPDHASAYRSNAEAYGRQLRGLDERFAAALTTCQRRVIVTAHGAFGYLAQRYGLTQEAITGISPEAEASPARLATLEKYVREHDVTTIFYEELVPRAFANTLAKAAHVSTSVLSPLEGLTAKEKASGDDYLSVMGRNREALVQALSCS